MEYQILSLPVLLKHHELAHYWTSFDVKYFNVEPLKYKWFYKRSVSVYNWPTTVVSGVSGVSCNKSMVPVKPSTTAHKKNDILLSDCLDIFKTDWQPTYSLFRVFYSVFTDKIVAVTKEHPTLRTLIILCPDGI